MTSLEIARTAISSKFRNATGFPVAFLRLFHARLTVTDKIRTMGNETVHQLKHWNKEDAELIGKLLMHLLRIIYELPNSI